MSYIALAVTVMTILLIVLAFVLAPVVIHRGKPEKRGFDIVDPTRRP